MITAQQGPLGNTLQIWMEDDNAPLVLARTATKIVNGLGQPNLGGLRVSVGIHSSWISVGTIGRVCPRYEAIGGAMRGSLRIAIASPRPGVLVSDASVAMIRETLVVSNSPIETRRHDDISYVQSLSSDKREEQLDLRNVSFEGKAAHTQPGARTIGKGVDGDNSKFLGERRPLDSTLDLAPSNVAAPPVHPDRVEQNFIWDGLCFSSEVLLDEARRDPLDWFTVILLAEIDRPAQLSSLLRPCSPRAASPCRLQSEDQKEESRGLVRNGEESNLVILEGPLQDGVNGAPECSFGGRSPLHSAALPSSHKDHRQSRHGGHADDRRNGLSGTPPCSFENNFKLPADPWEDFGDLELPIEFPSGVKIGQSKDCQTSTVTLSFKQWLLEETFLKYTQQMGNRLGLFSVYLFLLFCIFCFSIDLPQFSADSQDHVRAMVFASSFLGMSLVLAIVHRVTSPEHLGLCWHPILLASIILLCDYFLLGTSFMFSRISSLRIGVWPSASLNYTALSCTIWLTLQSATVLPWKVRIWLRLGAKFKPYMWAIQDSGMKPVWIDARCVGPNSVDADFLLPEWEWNFQANGKLVWFFVIFFVICTISDYFGERTTRLGFLSALQTHRYETMRKQIFNWLVHQDFRKSHGTTRVGERSTKEKLINDTTTCEAENHRMESSKEDDQNQVQDSLDSDRGIPQPKRRESELVCSKFSFLLVAELDMDTAPEKIATERSKQKYLKAKALAMRHRAATLKETASGVHDPNRNTSQCTEHASPRDVKPWLESLGHIGSVKSAEIGQWDHFSETASGVSGAYPETCDAGKLPKRQLEDLMDAVSLMEFTTELFDELHLQCSRSRVQYVGTFGLQFVCGVGLGHDAEATSEDAQALFQAAFEMQRIVRRLQASWHLPALTLRMGVHCGPAYLGMVAQHLRGMVWPLHSPIYDVARCICIAADGCPGILISSLVDSKLRQLARRKSQAGRSILSDSQRRLARMIDHRSFTQMDVSLLGSHRSKPSGFALEASFEVALSEERKMNGIGLAGVTASLYQPEGPTSSPLLQLVFSNADFGKTADSYFFEGEKNHFHLSGSKLDPLDHSGRSGRPASDQRCLNPDEVLPLLHLTVEVGRKSSWASNTRPRSGSLPGRMGHQSGQASQSLFVDDLNTNRDKDLEELRQSGDEHGYTWHESALGDATIVVTRDGKDTQIPII